MVSMGRLETGHGRCIHTVTTQRPLHPIGGVIIGVRLVVLDNVELRGVR